MYFLLIYDVVDDYLEKRAPYRQEHIAMARASFDRGELIMGGALANPPDGAILVFRGDTPGVATSFAEADPYVRAGLVTKWQVREWTVVIGNDSTT